MQDSDLDLTCVIPGKSVEYALEIFAENRKVVMSTLESAPGIEVLQEIWTARVPVVKMKFAGFLEVGKFHGGMERCHAQPPLQDSIVQSLFKSFPSNPYVYLLRFYSEAS